MLIKVERSGGLAGITSVKNIDSGTLPPDLLKTAQKIMRNKDPLGVPLKNTLRGSADFYSYKISIQDGVTRKVVKYSETNIPPELKSLINYIERKKLN